MPANPSPTEPARNTGDLRHALLFLLVSAATAAGVAGACLAFHSWRDPTFVLTAYHHQAPLAPLYAFWWPFLSWRIAVPFAITAVAVVLWSFIPAKRVVIFLVLATFVSVALRFSVHALRTPAPPGREFTTYPGEEIFDDTGLIRSPLDFLRDYPSLQPRLSLHGRTHPPGFALLHWTIRKIAGDDPAVTGIVLTILAALVVLPGYAIGRSIRGSDGDGRAAAMLLAASPGMVDYGAVSLDAIFAVVAALATAILVRELRAPGPAGRIALGLTLAIAMMLSYSTFLLGLLVAVALSVGRFRRPLARLSHLGQVGASFAIPLGALFLYPGFDAVACFLNARRINSEMMAEVLGRPLLGLPVWSYASIGNLLAFLITAGVPLVAGLALLVAPGRDGGAPAPAPGPEGGGPAATALAAAFVPTLAVACFGGLYLLETDRILLYLVPPVAALAALPTRFAPRTAFILAALQAIAMESALHTLW